MHYTIYMHIYSHASGPKGSSWLCSQTCMYWIPDAHIFFWQNSLDVITLLTLVNPIEIEFGINRRSALCVDCIICHSGQVVVDANSCTLSVNVPRALHNILQSGTKSEIPFTGQMHFMDYIRVMRMGNKYKTMKYTGIKHNIIHLRWALHEQGPSYSPNLPSYKI